MPRRILEGNVVSDKMDKTVTVVVERVFRHPVYKKYVRKSDKYAAHDEHNAFKTGDRVQIEECRPLSKRKTWRVITPVDPAMIKERPAKAAAAKPAPKKAAKPAAEKAEKKTETKKAASKKKDDKK